MKKPNIITRIITMPILRDVVLMGIIAGILILGVLMGLSRYTRTDQVVTVPNVKDMQLDDAMRTFDSSGLKAVISDSVYLVKGTPGAIIDQVPMAESQVKRGRTIFLIVQAKTAQMVAIPGLSNFSQRQAIAQLNSLGFTDITISKVASPYAGLVLSVSHKGRKIENGQKLPKGTPLVMTVGEGGIVDSTEYEIPSTEMVEIDESFF